MTAAFNFLSPTYYLTDDDARIEQHWARTEAKPAVFIQGLRRSGTTFLLNTLQQATNAAALRVCDIAYYRQRVSARLNNAEEEQLTSIDEFFKQNRLTHRPIDNVPLSPLTLDEFGFIYARLRVPQFESWLLKEIVTKLSFLYADAPCVVLKEPSIFSTGSQAHQIFPDAKFVFVHRDPVKTLVSHCRSLFWRRSLRRDWAYLNLLTGTPRSWSARLRSLLGPRRKHDLAMRVAREIVDEIKRYQQDIKEIPAAQVLHLRHEDMVRSTPTTIGRVVQFLSVAATMPLANFRSSARPAMRPERVVQMAGEWLTKELCAIGYPNSSIPNA